MFVSSGSVGTFNENAVQGGLVVDICNFARFGVQVISTLHESHAGRSSVKQNFVVDLGSRLVVIKLLKEVVDELGI